MVSSKISSQWLVLGMLVIVLARNPELEYEVQLQMPDVVPTKPDDLICRAFKLDSSNHQYIRALFSEVKSWEEYLGMINIPQKEDRIQCSALLGLAGLLRKVLDVSVEYKPNATRHVAHHMMVYGCDKPASTKQSWLCGGEERGEADVCEGEGNMNKRIVFAWALDAPNLSLPSGVGLRVGGDTSIQYMVLQLHYKRSFKEGETDRSGLVIRMFKKPQKKQMGFYILGNWGHIPPMRKEFYMESACYWKGNYSIYPFAYRTHSHNLGRVTSAYRIRNGTWTEIGRMSPQQPETFYNVTHSGIEIKPGDIIAARCTMSSLSRHDNTIIGATNHDEMCNFYFMYHTDEKMNLDDGYCFQDAQEFHWSDYFNNVPDSASSLTGVDLLRPEMEPLEYVLM